MQNTKIKKEFSAGCVVYKKFEIRNSKSEIKFLLGKHSGYHKWVLPKGLIEKGELGWQTALRETEEETAIRVKLISKKPIHTETYFYYAQFKQNQHPENGYANFRRVKKYQEAGGKKVKIFKTVSFYLGELSSGDLKNHGWEMSEVGWFSYDEALKMMSFKGEKKALKKALLALVK